MVDSSNHHFYENWLNFSQIFKVTLKFNNVSKVAVQLKSAIPTKLRAFRPLRTAAQLADTLHPSPLSILPGLTGGQGGGCAQCPHGAGSPQLAARHKRRGHREVKHSGGKVCREAPQRRSHRHLHSASDRPLSAGARMSRRVRVEWQGGGGRGRGQVGKVRKAERRAFPRVVGVCFRFFKRWTTVEFDHKTCPIKRLMTSLGRWQKNISLTILDHVKVWSKISIHPSSTSVHRF